MEQAIIETQKLIKDLDGHKSESDNPDDIKRDINNLLWKYMDGETKIEDADTLSMVILDMIQNPEKYLNPTNSNSL